MNEKYPILFGGMWADLTVRDQGSSNRRKRPALATSPGCLFLSANFDDVIDCRAHHEAQSQV